MIMARLSYIDLMKIRFRSTVQDAYFVVATVVACCVMLMAELWAPHPHMQLFYENDPAISKPYKKDSTVS